MTVPGRLAGRLALVTGASRGIGAAVAKRYAAEGAHVILVARSQGGLEEVDDAIRGAGGNATLCLLDLTEFEKVDQLAFAVGERFGHLDILVGNAGTLGELAPAGHVDPKVFSEVMAVNVTANWRLIRGFDPLLRRSDTGRALFVTDQVARSNPAYWSAYAASKAALEALVRSYAAELGKTAVKANLVDPGPVATRLRAKAFPGENPADRARPEDVTDVFVELAESRSLRQGELAGAS